MVLNGWILVRGTRMHGIIICVIGIPIIKHLIIWWKGGHLMALPHGILIVRLPQCPCCVAQHSAVKMLRSQQKNCHPRDWCCHLPPQDHELAWSWPISPQKFNFEPTMETASLTLLVWCTEANGTGWELGLGYALESMIAPSWSERFSPAKESFNFCLFLDLFLVSLMSFLNSGYRVIEEGERNKSEQALDGPELLSGSV